METEQIKQIQKKSQMAKIVKLQDPLEGIIEK